MKKALRIVGLVLFVAGLVSFFLTYFVIDFKSVVVEGQVVEYMIQSLTNAFISKYSLALISAFWMSAGLIVFINTDN